MNSGSAGTCTAPRPASRANRDDAQGQPNAPPLSSGSQQDHGGRAGTRTTGTMIPSASGCSPRRGRTRKIPRATHCPLQATPGGLAAGAAGRCRGCRPTSTTGGEVRRARARWSRRGPDPPSLAFPGHCSEGPAATKTAARSGWQHSAAQVGHRHDSAVRSESGSLAVRVSEL